MRNRLNICLIWLCIFVVLTGCGEGPITDYDQYFKDSDFISRTGNGMDDSGMVIGDDFRDFDQAAEALVSEGVLPEPVGSAGPDIWAKYDEARQVEVVQASWDSEDGYPMTMNIWPRRPEESDPYLLPYREDRVTVTETRGAVVIGYGKPDTVKNLYVELEDGTYGQIIAQPETTTAEMGVVLDHLLEHGFDFSRFDYASGQPLPVWE